EEVVADLVELRDRLVRPPQAGRDTRGQPAGAQPVERLAEPVRQGLDLRQQFLRLARPSQAGFADGAVEPQNVKVARYPGSQDVRLRFLQGLQGALAIPHLFEGEGLVEQGGALALRWAEGERLLVQGEGLRETSLLSA